VERAEHRVAVRQRRRDALEEGVPPAALPLGDGLEAAEAEVDEDEIDGGHRRDAHRRRRVLRHEDPVVLAAQDALGGEAIDRVGFEDDDAPRVRHNSLPTALMLLPWRAKQVRRGKPRSTRGPEPPRNVARSPELGAE
jgi:hypothetical protein